MVFLYWLLWYILKLITLKPDDNQSKKRKSKLWLVSAIFWFRAESKKVTSQSEPSWKSFSSSYGSSQLGSDSSLIFSRNKPMDFKTWKFHSNLVTRRQKPTLSCTTNIDTSQPKSCSCTILKILLMLSFTLPSHTRRSGS